MVVPAAPGGAGSGAVVGYPDAADYAVAGADPTAGLPDGWHFLPAVEDEVLAATDHARASARLPGLARDEGLRTAARMHARDMAVRGFFDHVNPDNRTPTDRVALLARQYVGSVGENIARRASETGSGGTSASALVAQWMGSPADRENMLRPEYTVVSIGIFAAAREIFAVQVFGERYAVLEASLPLTVPPGAAVTLRFQREARLPLPNGYDLWQSERGAAAAARAPLVDGFKAPRVPGQYRVRFYFPKAGGSRIADGPELVVGGG